MASRQRPPAPGQIASPYSIYGTGPAKGPEGRTESFGKGWEAQYAGVSAWDSGRTRAMSQPRTLGPK